MIRSVPTIPLADWYVEAILPTSEAFAPIYAMQQRMLIATVFLTLLAGGLTWWILRREWLPMLDTADACSRLPFQRECRLAAGKDHVFNLEVVAYAVELSDAQI